MSKDLTVLNRKTGKFEVWRDVPSDAEYLIRLLTEPDYKVMKWFIRVRFEQKPHDSRLYLLNEILFKEQIRPIDTYYIIKTAYDLAYEWFTSGVKKTEK